ncbi:RING-H2 finger protein ATL2-like [Wolffia australiana]
METSHGETPLSPSSSSKNYFLSGKVMLSAIVVLLAIVLIVLCLHLYARWFLLRSARRRRRRERRRLVLAAAVQGGAARGLDPAIIKSLPTFVFSAKESAESAESVDSAECAVCLCEFEPGEIGRVVPFCKHRFHVECIDLWFQGHATCPLCRAAVEAAPPPEPPEVRDRSAEDAASSSSSPSEEGLKPPIGRIQSLKRLLSIDLRVYRGSPEDLDLERGDGSDFLPGCR